jgi:hypothetical protein
MTRLQCDIITASTEAYFGLPEVKIGLIPGAGGTQRLTNIVGKYKAMHMILLGANITSDEAKAHGLVAEIYPAGSVLDNTLKLAGQLAQLSPGALSLAKEAIRRSTFSIHMRTSFPNHITKLFLFVQAMTKVGMMNLSGAYTTLLLALHTRLRVSQRSWKSDSQNGHEKSHLFSKSTCFAIYIAPYLYEIIRESIQLQNVRSLHARI